jgi:hypothetical protein
MVQNDVNSHATICAHLCAFAPPPCLRTRRNIFTEALNVSRGGFFFASSAALQIGMPIEATLRMPVEVTGGMVEEARCTARVVHVRNQPYGDGRIGFGVEIEEFRTRQPLGALSVQVDRHAN